MKMGRIYKGLSLLLGSSVLSWIISTATGVSSVGMVAVASIIAFIGGIVFATGCRR